MKTDKHQHTHTKQETDTIWVLTALINQPVWARTKADTLICIPSLSFQHQNHTRAACKHLSRMTYQVVCWHVDSRAFFSANECCHSMNNANSYWHQKILTIASDCLLNVRNWDVSHTSIKWTSIRQIYCGIMHQCENVICILQKTPKQFVFRLINVESYFFEHIPSRKDVHPRKRYDLIFTNLYSGMLCSCLMWAEVQALRQSAFLIQENLDLLLTIWPAGSSIARCPWSSSLNQAWKWINDLFES